MHEATTIQEVISNLETIIAEEISKKSNLIFFPILYKKVTERIELGIAQGDFEDNPRMERLDVIFANRYITAYDAYRRGEIPSVSWLKAFEAAGDNGLLILQHLLLGINAHINLDLGIAVSETADVNGDVQSIQNDFNKINDILSSMIDSIQEKIGQVSPLFYLLEKVLKGKEDAIASFSLVIARDEAWIFANRYHLSMNKPQSFEQRDASIGRLATKLYTTKSRFLRWVVKIVRWFERKDHAMVAQVLGGK